MNKAKISWSVLEDIEGNKQFVQQMINDADRTYSPGETYIKKIRVWNNRAGDEDILDALDSKLVIFFKNYEDSFLLNLCNIKIGDENPQKLNIDVDKGTFSLGTISGRANHGMDANKENYKEFELQFGPIPSNMKSELKSIIIDLEYS